MTARNSIILGTAVVVLIAAIGLGANWVQQRQSAAERFSTARTTALAAVGALASGNPDDINRAFGRPVPPDEAAKLVPLVPARVASDSRPMLAPFANPDGANRMVVEVQHPADLDFAVLVSLEAKPDGAGWTVATVRLTTAK